MDKLVMRSKCVPRGVQFLPLSIEGQPSFTAYDDVLALHACFSTASGPLTSLLCTHKLAFHSQACSLFAVLVGWLIMTPAMLHVHIRHVWLWGLCAKSCS